MRSYKLNRKKSFNVLDNEKQIYKEGLNSVNASLNILID